MKEKISIGLMGMGVVGGGVAKILEEKQVLLAVSNGVSDVDQMVKQIYPRNLKKALRRAAAGNVRTHLDKLVKDGTVKESPASYTLKG